VTFDTTLRRRSGTAASFVLQNTAVVEPHSAPLHHAHAGSNPLATL